MEFNVCSTISEPVKQTDDSRLYSRNGILSHEGLRLTDSGAAFDTSPIFLTAVQLYMQHMSQQQPTHCASGKKSDLKQREKYTNLNAKSGNITSYSYNSEEKGTCALNFPVTDPGSQCA